MSEDAELRAQVLEKLKEFQKKDFCELLKVIKRENIDSKIAGCPFT